MLVPERATASSKSPYLSVERRYEGKSLPEVVEGCSAPALSFAAGLWTGPWSAPSCAWPFFLTPWENQAPKGHCSRAFTGGENRDYPQAFSSWIPWHSWILAELLFQPTQCLQPCAVTNLSQGRSFRDSGLWYKGHAGQVCGFYFSWNLNSLQGSYHRNDNDGQL